MTGFGELPEKGPEWAGFALEPGDAVVVTVGKQRGTKGVLVKVEDIGSPSGGSVRVALIRRPRAGDLYVFPHMLAKADA